MKKNGFAFVLKSFLIWRILLFIPVLLAPYFFKLQGNFLGGGLQNYLSNPFFWSWANFDGEHYLSIAKLGYGNGEQAFFPLYPLIIRFISDFYGFKSPDLLVATGIFISNLCFLFALWGLYKLVIIDYSQKVARIAVLLVLTFPTAFYFAGVYTESLFFALLVWSFYFYKTGRYLPASLLGMFSSATRVVGIVLFPIYLIGMIYNKKPLKQILHLSFIPVGLVSYMLYSLSKWEDPLKFFNVASGFGEQRSDHLIVLPQVFYRYFVKIIPNLSWDYFPVIFTTFLEIIAATLFLGLILYVFYQKMKEKQITGSSYWLYLVLGYLVPTLSGSFSSLPRYVLILFPAFIYLAAVLEKINKYIVIGIYILMAIIAVVAQMLFVRGYFVS